MDMIFVGLSEKELRVMTQPSIDWAMIYHTLATVKNTIQTVNSPMYEYIHEYSCGGLLSTNANKWI